MLNAVQVYLLRVQASVTDIFLLTSLGIRLVAVFGTRLGIWLVAIFSTSLGIWLVAVSVLDRPVKPKYACFVN